MPHKKINKVMNVLDKLVSEFREKKQPQGYNKLLTSVRQINQRYNKRYNTNLTLNCFYNWNLNTYLPARFDSITHKPYKGLIISVDEYVEERKEERKQKEEDKNE